MQYTRTIDVILRWRWVDGKLNSVHTSEHTPINESSDERFQADFEVLNLMF